MSIRILLRNFAVAPVFVLLGIANIALLLRLAPLLRDGVGMDPDSARYIELALKRNNLSDY